MKKLVAAAVAPVAALASAVTVITLATPAMAASAAFADAHGDTTAGVDLHRVKVAHTEKNLRLTLTHADLVADATGVGVTVYVDTDRADRGPELAFVGGLSEGTDYALLRTEGWSLDEATRKRCAHRMRLDYTEEQTRIRLGRGCLAGAEEVRVAVRVADQDRSGTRRDWLGSRREFTAPVARG